MSNTITIELCKEDRQRLDEVIAFLGLIVGELKSRPAPTEAATAPQTAEKPEPVETETPAEDVTAPAEPEPVVEPKAPAFTRDDIQAMVIKLAAPDTGKKAQARAIVLEYAERVGLIPEDKFPEVMERLTALAKEG